MVLVVVVDVPLTRPPLVVGLYVGEGVTLGLGVGVGCPTSPVATLGVCASLRGEGEGVRRVRRFWLPRKTAKPSRPITRTVTRPTINDFMAYIIR